MEWRFDAPLRYPRRRLALLIYLIGVAVMLTAAWVAYSVQINRRLDELTREVRVAYESVTSTLAATPELFYGAVAEDETVTGIMAQANGAAGEEFLQLREELLRYLEDEYRRLQALDFRQLHFHLRDNRSFVRFHRPDRFGDDLTEVRPTVRETNATQQRSYGFEEGRIYNGFRYVYPLFYRGEHVGSVEASMSYRAIISRMRSSRPVIYDFVLDRNVVEEKVFRNEADNYVPSCFSDRFVREASFPRPETASVLGVDFSCILEAAADKEPLVSALESYRAGTLTVTAEGVAIGVSLLPLENFQGRRVAYILGYSRVDEIKELRLFFLTLAALLLSMLTAVFALFLRSGRQRATVLRVSEELRETIHSKDRFLSIISHDLRSPISALADATGMLRDDLAANPEVPEEDREMAQIVADSARNSYQLLSDLLDWSRSQRGDMAFDPEPQNLREIAEEQIRILSRQAEEKGITLENRLAPGATITADGYMLKTILRNLISNGIKFTEEGGVVSVDPGPAAGPGPLASPGAPDGKAPPTDQSAPDSPAAGPRAPAERQSPPDGFVNIRVTDTGVGMNQEQMESLFDPTVKSSRPGTRSEKGTGLGLLVCREFAVKHGGDIYVDSEPGVGTAFTVRLPERAADG